MKTKKYLGLLLIIIAFFLSKNIAIGEDISENQNSGFIPGNSGIQKTIIPFPTIDEKTNKLNYLKIKFCNDGFEQNDLTGNLFMTIRPEQKKEICIIFFNSYKEDTKVRFAFPDNAIEPNGNTNCSTNYGWDNPFSKFIKPTEDIINVPAMGYKIVKTTVKFPIGINGIQKGCYAFGVVGAEKSVGMLTFVNRKINYINILVKGNPYKKMEKLTDNIIENKNIVFGILFISILIALILEIKKYIKLKRSNNL